LEEAKERLDYIYMDTDYEFYIVDHSKQSKVYNLFVKIKEDRKRGSYGMIKKFATKYRRQFYVDKYKRVPDYLVQETNTILLKSFLIGYYLGDDDKTWSGRRFDCKGKIGSFGLYWILHKLGYNISVNTREDKPDIYRITFSNGKYKRHPFMVKKKYPVKNIADHYVYDIETIPSKKYKTSGQFHAGVGSLIVKNTDSVMMIFAYNVNDTFRISQKASTYMNELINQETGEKFFLDPINLEVEKVQCPFFLFGKKRYCTKEFGIDYYNALFKLDILIATDLGHTDEAKKLTEYLKNYKPKFVPKGIESKRRDSIPYVRLLIEDVCNILIGEKAIGKDIYIKTGQIQFYRNRTQIRDAIVYAQHRIRKLLRGDKDIPITDLILTNGLSKPPEEYLPGKNIKDKSKFLPQAHVQLALKIKKRSPGSEPVAGDRVKYVIIHDKEGRLKLSHKAELPEVVIKKRLNIDYDYIVNNKVMPPIIRIFGPIVGTNGFDHIDYLNWDKKTIDKETRKVIKLNYKEAERIFCANRVFQVKKPKMHIVKNKGLSMFWKKQRKCLCCGSYVNSRRSSTQYPQLCTTCYSRRNKVLSKKLGELREAEWKQHQNHIMCIMCQGDYEKTKICENKDCNYFYDKLQRKNDIEDLGNDVRHLFKKCSDVKKIPKLVMKD
jgi:hypothetical protein